MKKVRMMVSLLLVLVMLGTMCACGGQEGPIVMNLDMKFKLNEYDEKNGIIGREVSNGRIECGKKYTLSLVWENKDIESYNAVVGNKEIPLQIIVTIGGKNIFSKPVRDGGLDFTKISKDTNTYSAHFKIKENTYPDFTKGYFIIGVDSMEEKTADTVMEQVSVSIGATGDYAGLVSFTINGNENGTMKKDITVEKGTYEFSESKNVTRPTGHSVKKTTLVVELPEYCPGIKISVYKDKGRKERYGVTDLLTSVDNEKTVTVVMADYIKQYIGEEAYEEKLNNGGETFYLTITAVGANGYEDADLDMDYTVK